MILLIAAVLIGTIFGYIATQNTTPVMVNLAGMSWGNIPLYLVALLSLLGGLLLSGIFNMLDWVSSMMTINGKNRDLRRTEGAVQRLETRVKELEEENMTLRAVEQQPSVSERMRGFFHQPEHTPSV